MFIFDDTEIGGGPEAPKSLASMCVAAGQWRPPATRWLSVPRLIWISYRRSSKCQMPLGHGVEGDHNLRPGFSEVKTLNEPARDTHDRASSGYRHCRPLNDSGILCDEPADSFGTHTV